MKLKQEEKTLDIGELRRLISEERRATLALPKSFLLEHPEELDERQSIRNAAYPFRAIFLFGPAGSGKSFVSKRVGIPKYEDNKHGFRTVNPDQRIEDVFPAFGVTMKFAESDAESEKKAAKKAKEAGEEPPPRSLNQDEHVRNLEDLQQGMRAILQNASQGHTHNLIMKAKPIIFDTTGEDVQKMSSRIKELQRLGYTVGVLMVNVPPDVSVDRDSARGRTVGPERTRDISDRYQEEVVKMRGYFKSLSGTGAVIFGNDVYPNIFNLDSKQPLDGITDEHVAAMGNPTPQSADKLFNRIKSDVKQFLSGGEESMSAHGRSIYNGMKVMVKATGGEMGQNMGDLEAIWSDSFQKEYPGVSSDEAIQSAARYLAWLGGAKPTAEKGQRGRKDTGDETIRGMTKNDNPVPVGGDLPPDSDGDTRQRRWESSEPSIADIIKAAVLKVKKGIGE